MFLKMFLLIAGGAIFGAATSAGVIALLTKLGLVPRIIARLQLANWVMPLECAISLGAFVGCVTSIGRQKATLFAEIAPNGWQVAFMILVALCCGIYVGCQAMALAEILSTFPILFRRAKLQVGLRCAVVSLALGKLVGSLWYFIFGYQSV